MKCLRILVVEDDEMFRLGLSVRLQKEAGLQIVAEATDGETAIDLVNQYLPDVVLLDIGLPGIGGVEACRRIKAQYPKIPVLALTSHSQKPLIERLMVAGASGYCQKGIEADVLILALRSVVAGASWWDSTGTHCLREALSGVHLNPTTTPLELNLANPLTKRELEILALITGGYSNQEIAERLHITVGTVRVHVHTILQKLDVRDRTSAAVLALQHKLISLIN